MILFIPFFLYLFIHVKLSVVQLLYIYPNICFQYSHLKYVAKIKDNIEQDLNLKHQMICISRWIVLYNVQQHNTRQSMAKWFLFIDKLFSKKKTLLHKFKSRIAKVLQSATLTNVQPFILFSVCIIKFSLFSPIFILKKIIFS